MAIYSSSRRRTMLILLLTSVLLITLDLRGNAVFNAARSGFGYALRPFEVAGEVITRPIERVIDGMTRVDELETENEFLQEELDKSRAAQIVAEAAIEENRQLRDLLDIAGLSAFDSRTCSIIGQSPSNFDQRVEISCGSLEGLRVGMPVVNGAGLVGKITNVSLQSSIVMLVTDPLYHVTAKVIAEVDPSAPTTVPDSVPSGLPVGDVTTTTSTSTTTTTTNPLDSDDPDAGDSADESTSEAGGDAGGERATPGLSTSTSSTTSTSLPPVTRETGSLDGRGGDRLPRMSFIAESRLFGVVQVGDAVLTAGGSESLAPPDIPIGRVANIIPGEGVEGLGLEVELSADLNRLSFLTVVLYVPPREASAID